MIAAVESGEGRKFKLQDDEEDSFVHNLAPRLFRPK